MPLKKLSHEEIRGILIKNWMTHDALWFGEAAMRFGMAEASPMNLRVCRQLGRIEFRRLMKAVNASNPKDFSEYMELFEMGREVFVPDFMEFQTEYPGDDSQVVHVLDCFAHKGMERAGLIADYECGIFERIEGWLDAMELKYTRTPDLSRCLKFKGEVCKVYVRFDF
ncbi:MAG: hypothetical protein JRG97_02910 [Deltaproteobacteria bacterium]|nr:hypothetical protein [Deltaproteobacteria bacterium]MBW2051167.1 hypothetical protein [Deltaproteobacteria bacterium]MBW2140007.1 hypothetical protein [Deltaproteobacteria bacterium]MBW2322329.1 hypothetical protein [Deltaproteobacteria bacterium]